MVKPLPTAPFSAPAAPPCRWTRLAALSVLSPALCGHTVRCLLTPVESPLWLNLPSPSLATWQGRASVAARRRRLLQPTPSPVSHPGHFSPKASSPTSRWNFSSPAPRRQTTAWNTCAAPARTCPASNSSPTTRRWGGRVCPHVQAPPPAGNRPQTRRPSLALAFPLRDGTCSALLLTESFIRAGAGAAQAPHATAGEPQPPSPSRCCPEVAGDAHTAAGPSPSVSVLEEPSAPGVPAALRPLPSQATALTSVPNTPLKPSGQMPSLGLSAKSDAAQPSSSSA